MCAPGCNNLIKSNLLVSCQVGPQRADPRAMLQWLEGLNMEGQLLQQVIGLVPNIIATTGQRLFSGVSIVIEELVRGVPRKVRRRVWIRWFITILSHEYGEAGAGRAAEGAAQGLDSLVY